MKLRSLLILGLVLLATAPAAAQAPRTVIAEMGSATW
jgi:hypothetical protein